MKKIVCGDISELPAVAREVISCCEGLPVWVFQGDMGAGKTTLIKSIAKELGVGDVVSSPSFAIVNEYQNDKGQTFYHFDFYRIEEQEEVLEIGIDEYFYSGNHCWVEWAEKILDYLPEEFYLIKISVDENEVREMRIKKMKDGG
ncbi:tRNA (adenosine(37)-N6)-threonylcarbamoyltransferase complex ATPase subunit type 1 TsaE [Echinicola strongylocentroti]|uniref:tRNA threonylcarbamoyladenosine biosynthesis protein TsaE n=1 Tax=Echinicola strongylocentroti TaxID=1795355 RepID=A0A2Z4ILS7_9BACT|nr:tRNA (adenosine(37)-N6)-threonylcarbamoyltransferase complex ATPase subunit type 1 TsaE [Echinicola strongylocentroti]AWW31680.1 tRNA (adenosine(37)-N6)-threonylcarbamoyltransferase complex ATPase subunit type 1 TsaE [Echinicola strongylocentroti]